MFFWRLLAKFFNFLGVQFFGEQENKIHYVLSLWLTGIPYTSLVQQELQL